jgi:hypothetical protein
MARMIGSGLIEAGTGSFDFVPIGQEGKMPIADFRAQFAVEVGIFRTLATASAACAHAHGCVSQRARPLSRLAAPSGGPTPCHSQMGLGSADASIRVAIPRSRRCFVGITIRVYYDAVIAVALMAVVAIICGFIAAVITGGSPPNFPVAAVAFLLTGAVLFLRLWRNSRPSAFPPD